MANPSIPSLPASTQVEVKTAITNIANWINLFNKSLGDVVGTSSSTVDSSYYSSALYKFVESTLLGDQAIANIIKKLEGEVTETQLHKDLVDRINLIDDPDTGLSTKASVTQLTNAITTLDTALSQDITQLSTTVDNNTSSIETLAQVTDGIQAEYTVKLNNNNKVAGFGLMLSENEPSTFEVVADKFAIVNYDGVTSTVPFQVTGGVTVLKSALIGEAAISNAKIQNAAITTAKIGDAQVDTLKIKGNAVTIPVSSFSYGPIALDSIYTYIQSVNIDSGGNPVIILINGYAKSASTLSSNLDLSLRCNGIEIFNYQRTAETVTNYYALNSTISATFVHSPQEGINVYSLYGKRPSYIGINIRDISILCLGVKR